MRHFVFILSILFLLQAAPAVADTVTRESYANEAVGIAKSSDLGIPLPNTLWLTLSGLIALSVIRRRRY